VIFGTREHHQFLKDAREKAADQEHGKKILKAITNYNIAVDAGKAAQFCNWQEARKVAAKVKQNALEKLPELLETFEKKATANGVQVLWAEDSKEALCQVLTVAIKHGVRKAVKSKSMTTEEVDLNQALAHEGVEVWETDLGELIVQLAGERPYHIVTPAMHKSRAEIGELFARTLGTPLTDNAEELTAAARAHLRKAFCTAELGITGANFLIASEGAVVLTENEGNARLTTSCPEVHVAIAGIEKILPTLEDLELFLPLLATSGTGQHMTCYNSIIRGPKRAGEIDGPSAMYVILLDNGRSKLYADAKVRKALTCIRCGACLNACPVYRTVGGHTYNTAYPGPIGAVITPHLRGLKHWHHLSSASSLCGACSEVCPVDIKLQHYLLENRWSAYKAHVTSLPWNVGFKVWAMVYSRRWLLQLLRPFLKLGSALAPVFLPQAMGKRMPKMAKKSFSELWREHEQ
jgi:L-lactate dehydrogenase complex protein LldF